MSRGEKMRSFTKHGNKRELYGHSRVTREQNENVRRTITPIAPVIIYSGKGAQHLAKQLKREACGNMKQPSVSKHGYGMFNWGVELDDVEFESDDTINSNAASSPLQGLVFQVEGTPTSYKRLSRRPRKVVMQPEQHKHHQTLALSLWVLQD